MKSLKIIFAILLISMTVKSQVITDTSRFNAFSQGHLKSLIEEFKNNCLSESKHYNYKNVAFSNKGTIAFLNKAFQSQLFNRYCFLEKSSSEITSSDNVDKFSFGLIEVGFRSEGDNENVIETIKSHHSNYLQLEVATEFILLKERNGIIILFVEISDLKYENLKCFFDRLKNTDHRYIPIR